MNENPINFDEGSSASIVDFVHFDLMVDGLDSPCVEIYRDWVNRAGQSIAELCEAAFCGDSEKVKALAHQLKGSSASLGLVGFSTRMREVEEHVRSGADPGSVLDADWREATLRLLDATVALIEAERGISC